MGERITKTVVVHRNVSEVYNLWANFDNFPNFMSHIREVRKTGGERQSHWVMEGPMGKDVEWDARTTAMEPNRRIAWESTGGDINTTGDVNFREIGPNETEVSVHMTYEAKGAIADTVAKYFTPTGDWLEDDLRNFKRYAEEMGSTAGAGMGSMGSRSGYGSDTDVTRTGTGTSSTRERAGAGAFGSTTGDPVGGSIGGTSGGAGSVGRDTGGFGSTTGGTGGTVGGSTTGGLGTGSRSGTGGSSTTGSSGSERGSTRGGSTESERGMGSERDRGGLGSDKDRKDRDKNR